MQDTNNMVNTTPPLDKGKSSELLPLINRYHAAWLEHGTRIAQRQNIVQVYLATAGIIFGFYFHNSGSSSSGPDINYFLLFGVTLLTVVCTLLLSMHYQVIQKLCGFMTKINGVRVKLNSSSPTLQLTAAIAAATELCVILCPGEASCITPSLFARSLCWPYCSLVFSARHHYRRNLMPTWPMLTALLESMSPTTLCWLPRLRKTQPALIWKNIRKSLKIVVFTFTVREVTM